MLNLVQYQVLYLVFDHEMVWPPMRPGEEVAYWGRFIHTFLRELISVN